MNKDFYQKVAEDMAVEYSKQVTELSLMIHKLTEDRDYWRRRAEMHISVATAVEEDFAINPVIKADENRKFQLLYGGKA